MAASGKSSGKSRGGKSGARKTSAKKAVAKTSKAKPAAAAKSRRSKSKPKPKSKSKSEFKAQPKAGSQPETKAPAVRPAEFRARLGSLENLLDEALEEAGGPIDVASDEGPVVRAAEGMLDVYARLGRTLEEGSVADALTGLSERMRGDPDDFGFDAEFEGAIMPLLRFLFRSWWRVEVAGVQEIPDQGPVVLVGNHSGSVFAYDGAMLRRAVAEQHGAARQLRPLLDPAVCDLPVLGDIMARCGGVPASEENGAALLARGEVVAFFPEGAGGFGKPFGRRYELGSFGGGDFVRSALRSGAPIVPVAIVGAEETHPVLGRLDWVARRIGMPFLPLTPTFPWLGLGGLMPLPSRWRIEFGAPVSGLEGLAADAADDRRQVRRITARVRTRVQALVDQAVERRGRVFF